MNVPFPVSCVLHLRKICISVALKLRQLAEISAIPAAVVPQMSATFVPGQDNEVWQWQEIDKYAAEFLVTVDAGDDNEPRKWKVNGPWLPQVTRQQVDRTGTCLRSFIIFILF